MLLLMCGLGSALLWAWVHITDAGQERDNPPEEPPAERKNGLASSGRRSVRPPPRAHRPPPADTVREHLHAGQPSSPCTGLWSVSSSELSTLTELCWFCVASHLFSTKHCVVGMLLWVYPAKALALQLPFYQELHTVASRVSTETGQMMYSWCLRIEKSFPGEELWFS